MRGQLGVEGAQTPSALWVRRVSGTPLLPRWARRGREGRATLGGKEGGWPTVTEQPRERRHTHPRRPVSSPDPPKDQIRGQRVLGSEKHTLPTEPGNAVGVLCGFSPCVNIRIVYSH